MRRLLVRYKDTTKNIHVANALLAVAERERKEAPKAELVAQRIKIIPRNHALKHCRRSSEKQRGKKWAPA